MPEVCLVGCSTLVHVIVDGFKDVSEDQFGHGFLRCAAESVSEGCSPNEVRSVMGIVDGRPTSKVVVCTAMPAVGNAAIYVVWRRLEVADTLKLNHEDPERVVKLGKMLSMSKVSRTEVGRETNVRH